MFWYCNQDSDCYKDIGPKIIFCLGNEDFFFFSLQCYFKHIQPSAHHICISNSLGYKRKEKAI